MVVSSIKTLSGVVGMLLLRLQLLLIVEPTVEVAAFSSSSSVSALLQQYDTDITSLKEEARLMVGNDRFENIPYNNDVFYLRYCLDGKGVEDLKTTLVWRLGDGKVMCDAAKVAYEAATTTSSTDPTGEGGWDNDPIRKAAPSADIVNEYITESSGMTTTSSKGDILYIIRAGKINDKELMSKISIDDLVMFFLYSKEIIALTANDRSIQTNKLVYVLTVNDLNGLKLIGGGGQDASFRSALSASSKLANEMYYPALGGPTLLVNLPRVVSVLVKLFKPIIPKKVWDKIKFAQGPLKDVEELVDVTPGGKHRDSFLADVDTIAY